MAGWHTSQMVGESARRAGNVIRAAVFCGLVVVGWGCQTDKSVSGMSGTGALNAQPVALPALPGDPATCSPGYAHPTVCCSAGPGLAAVCVGYPAAPFQMCDPGSFAYPDGRTCCPLDGNGECVNGSASPVDGSSAGECYYPCAPGGYSPSKLASTNGTPLCSTENQNQDCEYCCYDTQAAGPVCVSNLCSCPASGPCACGPQCGSCPSGWDAPKAGQADLCCQTEQNGTTKCFSQATRVLQPSQ